VVGLGDQCVLGDHWYRICLRGTVGLRDSKGTVEVQRLAGSSPSTCEGLSCPRRGLGCLGQCTLS